MNFRSHEPLLRTQHVDVVADGRPVSRAAFMAALATSTQVRQRLTEVLRGCPFDAVAWETPAYGIETSGLAAEFVLVESPQLAMVTADPGPFAEHFKAACGVAVFQNLGRSSTLVAPTPRAGVEAAHLLAYLRSARDSDVDALWATVGGAMREVPVEPVWLSTAGLGVSWLHVRIDPRPKYYRYGPYRSV